MRWSALVPPLAGGAFIAALFAVALWSPGSSLDGGAGPTAESAPDSATPTWSAPGESAAHYNVHSVSARDFDLAELRTADAAPLIRFRLRRTASLDVSLISLSRRSSFEVLAGREFQPGDHTIALDALRGHRLLPGAYLVDFVDRGPDGVARPYESLNRLHWRRIPNARVTPTHRWSRIGYHLTAPALVRLRVGTPAGLVLATVVNTEYRAAGEHVERWKRRDSAERVVFPPGSSFEPSLEIAELPSTVLVVSYDSVAGSGRVKFDPRAGRLLPKPIQSDQAARTYAALSPARLRGDYPLVLSIEDHPALRASDRVATLRVATPPLPTGETSPRVRLKIYLDMSPVFDEEVELPFSHARRFEHSAPGAHLYCVMVTDAEGNVGTASLPFQVKQ